MARRSGQRFAVRPPLVLTTFAAEARTLFRPSPRLIDECECAVSVLIAIVFAHWLGTEHVSWAAFSGYAVMRGHVAETLLRGTLRIIGTAIGAALALVLVPPLTAGTNIVIVAVVAGVIGGVSLYGAIAGRRAYAWLFLGLTFEMILLDRLEHPDVAIRAFAITRFEEVCAGTLACVLVSLASTLTLRRIWPAPRTASPPPMQWHPHAFRHALQAGVAVTALPILWVLFHIPQLAQSAITVLATMLLPLTSIGASGFAQVSRRLLNRVIGCLAGALLAAIVLFAAHGSPTVLLIGTLGGVILGRHFENGGTTVAYLGTQFVLAVLVTLVPDHYDQAAIGPAIERLTGILVGIAILEPMLLAWHLFAPKSEVGRPAAIDAGGD